jgi:SAM-dependent methyltransferase
MRSTLGQPADLRYSVIERFRRIAVAPVQEPKFPVGPASAKRLGYNIAEIDALPVALTESFCGVGNPFSLGEPSHDQSVLDLGCGAGFDTVLATRLVGPAGRAIGIDLTPAMVSKARASVARLGFANVAFLLGDIARLPLPDDFADLVISNGVLNLCFDKATVLAEAHRVLKPHGRFQMADILLEPYVTPEQVAQKGTWSD